MAGLGEGSTLTCMRKQFPSPKGHRTRSFADLYSSAKGKRKGRAEKSSKPSVKFQGEGKPFNFSLGRTKSDSQEHVSWIFFLIPALPALSLLLYIFLS